MKISIDAKHREEIDGYKAIELLEKGDYIVAVGQYVGSFRDPEGNLAHIYGIISSDGIPIYASCYHGGMYPGHIPTDEVEEMAKNGELFEYEGGEDE